MPKINIVTDHLVKHGKWTLADDGDGVVCSCCGTDYCNLIYNTDRFYFCPNCGARMDLGEDQPEIRYYFVSYFAKDGLFTKVLGNAVISISGEIANGDDIKAVECAIRERLNHKKVAVLNYAVI